jgi:hypothetical protein
VVPLAVRDRVRGLGSTTETRVWPIFLAAQPQSGLTTSFPQVSIWANRHRARFVHQVRALPQKTADLVCFALGGVARGCRLT